MAEPVYLLLGSNLGDREKYLDRARIMLAEMEGFEVTAASSIYLSEAVDMAPGTPSFMNQVIKGAYLYTPHELLHACERLEQSLGRTDKGNLQPRTIDIDILFFGNEVIKTPTLVVPHPRLESRPFALVPLLEIDPHLMHPTHQQPVAEYLKPEDRHSVVVYREYVARNN